MGHGIPEFMVDDTKKPKGPYEWSIWLLVTGLTVFSFLIILVPMVCIAAAMAIVGLFCGDDE